MNLKIEWKRIVFFVWIILSAMILHADEEALVLRENLKKAQKDDFIVTAANKNLTVLHIYDLDGDRLTIEEITVAENRKIPQVYTWQEWIGQGAPYHSSWMMYEIDLKSGQILKSYSFTKHCWMRVSDGDSFLSKLLNLRFSKIPEEKRKRVGRGPNKGGRPLWQPQMIVNGQRVPGVEFDAWKTQWPRDGGDLSGKLIEVYLPKESDRYPSYFPYWLEISGFVGSAKIRIIDSGHGMRSPQPSWDFLQN